jgi:hypothetical protein
MALNAAKREKPEFNKTPVALTAIFLELLRAHFRFNNAPEYKYDTDPKLNKISIDPSYAYKNDEVGKRPAIIVKRGPVQFAKITFGNRFGSDPTTGTLQFMAQEQGYLTFMCLSKVALESELIATDVAEFLQSMCLVLSNQYNFLTLNIDAVGEVGILEEYKEIYMTPVTLTFAAQKVWEIYMESVKLKRVLLNIDQIIQGQVNLDDIIEDKVPLVDRFPENAVENELTFNEPNETDALAKYGEC